MPTLTPGARKPMPARGPSSQIAAAFDVTLAWHVVVGIPNDHAAAARGAIASTAVVTDQPNWLQQIRVCVFAAGIDVRSICATNKQHASAGQQRDGEFPHEILLIRAKSALCLKPCRSFSFPANFQGSNDTTSGTTGSPAL